MGYNGIERNIDRLFKAIFNLLEIFYNEHAFTYCNVILDFSQVYNSLSFLTLIHS